LIFNTISRLIYIHCNKYIDQVNIVLVISVVQSIISEVIQ